MYYTVTRWLKVCLLIVGVCTILVGCGGGLKSQIIGKWAEPTSGGYPNIYEFFEDGSLVTTSAIGGTNMTYEVLEDGRLKLNFRGMFGGDRTVIYQVKFEDGGDTLVLLGDNGGRMQRVKE